MSEVPNALRRMLRVAARGISTDGTYVDDEGQTITVTSDEASKLEALTELGYLDQGWRPTKSGRAHLNDPGVRAPGTRPDSDRSTCPSAKVRYATEATAAEGLGRHRKHSPKGSPRMRVYACPWCGGWHLTKRPSWTPR